MPVWKPLGTYGLLGAMAGVFILQWVTILAAGGDVRWHSFLWTVAPDWPFRPWSPFTSTLAHSPANFTHILFNGLMLYFFGPILEQLVGTRRFVVTFMIAGAVSGVGQVMITGGGALGASGAIMMVMGALAVVMPKQQLLLFGIIPMPFWLATAGYAAMDLIGALGPADGIGHIAHLAGLAIGLWIGSRIRAQRQSTASNQGRRPPIW